MALTVLRKHCVIVLAAGIVPALTAQAQGPRWKLIYCRQLGNHENANRHVAINHLFRQNGQRAANIGVTNRYSPDTNLFGVSDINGFHRITLTEDNCAYDMQIHEGTTPTDQTPIFYWYNPPGPATYYFSYVDFWLYVSDSATITVDPFHPVFHYDRTAGLFNTASGIDPATCVAEYFSYPWFDAGSDRKQLTTWSTHHSQTFVVPPGVNRIVAASAFPTRAGGQTFAYRASIRQGGIFGPQIGPSSDSPTMFSSQFIEGAVNWSVDDVPVTPGQTYALRIESVDGAGFNVYATEQNNYADGTLYNGDTRIDGIDMLAVVVGVGYQPSVGQAPVIQCSPPSFTRQVPQRENLTPADAFTLSNPGQTALNYNIADDASWLAVSPTTGQVGPGGGTPIALTYQTAALSRGSYTATVTVSDPLAANSPQAVTVYLTVGLPLYSIADFNRDGDVDHEDFGHMQACLSELNLPPPDPACFNARLDPDVDVDQADLAVFLDCYSGPAIGANPICDE
ncbi:MAG: hypothetical protein HY718_06285 [Planctomycetes bacterium]|nr:hypothetical protein [Planctomycetota bacterium]